MMFKALLCFCLIVLLASCSTAPNPAQATPLSDFKAVEHPPQDPVDEMIRARSPHSLEQVIACADARGKRARRHLDGYKVASITAQIHGANQIYWLVAFVPRDPSNKAAKTIEYLISDRLAVNPKEWDFVEVKFITTRALQAAGVNPEDEAD